MSCFDERRFRAPGKLVLMGEYAVLDGAPAVVAAIDHGVDCVALPGPGPRTVETPADDRFAAAALERVDAPGGHYRFLDWNPVELDMGGRRSKPGFGGSASATVAAVRAGLALRGRTAGPNTLFDLAREVHRSVQGSGSGVDVAAAVYGGVLRFARGNVRVLPPVQPVVVWSGASARTGPRVEAYLRWTDRDRFVRRSTELVDDFADQPIATMREMRRLLEAMAVEAGIDYRNEALDRVARLAEERNGAAKPSGAGGGDCAVALFDDPEAEAVFVQACAREGLLVIPAALAPGVRALTPEEPR